MVHIACRCDTFGQWITSREHPLNHSWQALARHRTAANAPVALTRIQSKLELGIEILLNGSQNTSIYLSGYSSDVSIGGICFILDEISLNSSSEISSFEDGIKNAKVQVNFLIEDLKVSIPGKIAWLSQVSHEGRKTIALGIQFDEMSPKLKGILMMFFNSFHKK